MKTFEGIDVEDKEVEEILKKLEDKGILNFNPKKLMDNMTISEDSTNWEIRISKVSAKDLPKHDERFFTDGNHNGRCTIVPRKR